MNPTRILPDLQASLLCEEVRQEANGNFFLIGVVNFLRVPQLPIVAARLKTHNRAATMGSCGTRRKLTTPMRKKFPLASWRTSSHRSEACKSGKIRVGFINLIFL